MPEIICKICSKEIEYPSNYEYSRGICASHATEIEEKEKKSFGWFIYHFLKVEKKGGKFIIPGQVSQSQDKYGLQKIFINRITDEITFYFYFGRSFVHRPELRFPLNKVKEAGFRESLLSLISEANDKNFSLSGRQNKIEKIYEMIKKW